MLPKWFRRYAKFTIKSEANGTVSSQNKQYEGHVAVFDPKGISAKLNGVRDVAIACNVEPKLDSISEIIGRQNSSTSDEETPEIKVYRSRFWMLFLFTLCNLLNGMQWVQYTVIADITMCYYGVDINAVNWTANLYLILYAPLVFPVSWLMDRMGMRTTLLVGSFCNCISTIVQCLTSTPNSFSYVLVSQAIVSIGQVFILAGPPFLAALWFPENELSRACAIGVFGNQFGIALGFIFPSLVVIQDCTKISTISYQKGIVAYTLTGCNLALFLLIVGTFKDRPDKPPSLAQAHKGKITTNYKRSLLNLSKNLHFYLLLIMYGLICGVYFALATLLNSLVLPYFPGKDKEIGWMGFILIVSGLVGSIIAGYILDWKHKYRLTSIGIFFLSLVSFIAFSGLLRINYMWVQFVTIAILGFFLTSYLPVGFEFGAEITYPEPESTTGSLLNASTMVFGFVITFIGSKILETYGDLAANVFLCSLLCVGCVVSVIIKCDYRRKKLIAGDQKSHLEQINDATKKPDYESINIGLK